MTKLEEKLIELGYVKLTHNYMTRLTRYKKEFAFSHINFYIRDNEIVMYGVCPTCDYQTQYEIDDLQQTFNQLQKDLEVLKGGFKRMIDLRKEIEDLKTYECEVERTQHIQWMKDCYLKQDLDNLLDQYNIITAPKTIKLSEIVNKLNKIFNDSEFSREIYFNRKLNAIGEGEYDKDWFMNTWTPFIRFKENKISEIVKSGNERTKWLYALWIAGTIIEDDLKEE